jgi:hypothetical protein
MSESDEDAVEEQARARNDQRCAQEEQDTELDALVSAPHQDGGHDNVNRYWHGERGRRP